MMSFDSILESVRGFDCKTICVTGGEPLAQAACNDLLNVLCDAGFDVSLETSGALPIADVDRRVSRVMDLKAPDSGESHRNLWDNIAELTPHDQIKFVISSRRDYDWARFKVDELALAGRVGDILFSPTHGELQPRELAEWLLQDGVPGRFQLQLHKLLWNDAPGH